MFMHHKCIEGFNLLNFLQHGPLSKERIHDFFRLIRDDFDKSSRGDLFFMEKCGTEKTKEFKLEDIDKALTALEDNPRCNVVIKCNTEWNKESK
jgi:hypothetical protein